MNLDVVVLELCGGLGVSKCAHLFLGEGHIKISKVGVLLMVLDN